MNDGEEVSYNYFFCKSKKKIFFSPSGETVTKDEQINLHDIDETLSTTQSMMSLSTVSTLAVPSAVTTLAVGNPLGGLDLRVNADEWEKERSALYQQLDEKVIEINFYKGKKI